MKITEFIDRTNTAHFSYYREGYMFYRVRRLGTTEWYQFAIDTKDLGTATVNHTEKAITLMRYIRRAMQQDPCELVRTQDNE